MYCDKCGKQIADGSKFCEHCGERIAEDVKAAGNSSVQEKLSILQEILSADGRKGKLSRRGFMAALAVVLVIVAAVSLGRYISGAPARKLAEQLDLGNRYLEEMDYEQAVIAFARAIEIDPMSVDAYLGLINAQLGLRDIPAALETARKGYEVTGNVLLETEMQNIEIGDIYDSLYRLKLRIGYDDSGNVAWLHEYTYHDEEEKIASVAAYDNTGEELGQIELSYDEDNRVTTGFWYQHDWMGEWHEGDGEIGLVKYSYQDGQLVREDYFKDTAGNELFAAGIFKDGGREERREYYRDNRVLQGYSELKYDSEGRVVEEIAYWEAGAGFDQIIEYTWKWDDETWNGGLGTNGAYAYGLGEHNYYIYRYNEGLAAKLHQEHGHDYPIDNYFWHKGRFLLAE